MIGESGCGKSTCIPEFLIRAGYESVAITLPWRAASVSLSFWVAELLNSEVGETVWFKVGFE